MGALLNVGWKRETEIQTGELKKIMFHIFLKLLAFVTLPDVCDEKTQLILLYQRIV